MRFGRHALMLPVVALFVLSACGGGDGGSNSAQLEGTSWELTSLAGSEGSLTSLPTPITARFEGGSVSGSGGCNSYHGSHQLDGGDLTIGSVASTQMACDPDVSAHESAYLAALEKVQFYRIEGDSLSLVSEDEEDLLTYAASTQ